MCRDLRKRADSYPNFKTEFGHLEGDTIVGEKHKSAVITLVECLSKAIITLKTNGRKASDIEASINQWLSQVPSHLFKSITFDCGKEFSNWKSISNTHDIDIFFADPGCPGQRGLNEHSNGLLRRNGLPKQMDFTNVSQNYEAGTKVLASQFVFGLSRKTQWLSGLYYADFISFYSPTQLCGGGTTKSNSNELPISVPISLSFVANTSDFIENMAY